MSIPHLSCALILISTTQRVAQVWNKHAEKLAMTSRLLTRGHAVAFKVNIKRNMLAIIFQRQVFLKKSEGVVMQNLFYLKTVCFVLAV